MRRCPSCDAMATLQNDDSLFFGEGDQWYECANGHTSKPILRATNRR